MKECFNHEINNRPNITDIVESLELKLNKIK